MSGHHVGGDHVGNLAPIACLGAGRMACGIAVAFAYAGHSVTLIDAKAREPAARRQAADAALGEVRAALSSLAALGLFPADAVEVIAGRVGVVEEGACEAALTEAAAIFEAVPELPELKRDVLARISARAGSSIIASTTSTIVVDDLAPAIAQPQRFLNAHWLNPAFLIPLVEVSPGAQTEPEVVRRLTALLEGIGKVPVLCAARPGYIVPRIQALAMNEAARLVEEGVASAADIDKAVKYGFAFRFANLGLLEFIDYGGGDILYHASRYLVGALGSERYACPQIIASNMQRGNIGLKTGRGFLDYADLDMAAYRHDRLAALVTMLKFMGLARPPLLAAGG
jgi:3-hydroxybutyryl-CoA dehydrogenase